MKSQALVFGSLASPLARAQTQTLIDRIQKAAPRLSCRLNVLASPVTEDSRDQQPFLASCRADIDFLCDALRRGECRVFVAEASDLPVPLPEGIEAVCVPARNAPFDAYLNQQGLIMDEMDPGSRVGVLSMRSKTQMQGLWPDLEFLLLPGGVDRAMDVHMNRSEIDGLVLPAAVTEHLGIQGIVAEIFSPEFILPGPGQGSLLLLGAAGDDELRELLAGTHSRASALEYEAEAAFRSRMVTDLDLPLGALARIKGPELAITGTTGKGRHRVIVHGKPDEAEAVGSGLAQELLCSVHSFADLLEADFPDGLPPDPDDEKKETDTENDEDLVERFMDGQKPEDI